MEFVEGIWLEVFLGASADTGIMGWGCWFILMIIVVIINVYIIAFCHYMAIFLMAFSS